MAYIWTINST